MSKTIAGVCVGLLSFILVVQIVTLFVGMRQKVVVVPMRASANQIMPDSNDYDSDYLMGASGVGTTRTPQPYWSSSSLGPCDDDGC